VLNYCCLSLPFQQHIINCHVVWCYTAVCVWQRTNQHTQTHTHTNTHTHTHTHTYTHLQQAVQ
jgi:hypothetical protein